MQSLKGNFARYSRIGVEAGHLAQGVHSGVGPSRAGYPALLACDARNRSFYRALHSLPSPGCRRRLIRGRTFAAQRVNGLMDSFAHLARLHLKAPVSGAYILQHQADPAHITTPP